MHTCCFGKNLAKMSEWYISRCLLRHCSTSVCWSWSVCSIDGDVTAISVDVSVVGCVGGEFLVNGEALSSTDIIAIVR